MVWIPGGSFVMGEDPRYPEEGPPRRIKVQGFWMDAHEVTNGQFASFVRATHYRTVAERTHANSQAPGSAIFAIPSDADPQWWRWMPGAQWRHPSGPTGSIVGGEALPVVQIAYNDATAYARWVGKALPTEAQWEYAARGGSSPKPEPVAQDGTPRANFYQGMFPVRDLAIDGFAGLAPVGCFPANGFGLYDMIGNVWEWTSTEAGRSPGGETVGIIKGGSFLCAANYCARYRAAARQFEERGLGTNHIGFRLIDTRRAEPG